MIAIIANDLNKYEDGTTSDAINIKFIWLFYFYWILFNFETNSIH